MSKRTLIRWAKGGKLPRPFVDPTDPLKRVLYDRAEVDRIVRNKKLRASAPDLPLDPGLADLQLAHFDSLVPGPLAATIYEMLRERKSIGEICRATAVPPEHVIRLDQMQRKFEAERGPPPAPRALKPRIVTDENDPDLAAWARELDAERALPVERERESADRPSESGRFEAADDDGGD